MTKSAMSKAELMTELAALRRRMDELEAERQQIEVERDRLLVAEQERRPILETLPDLMFRLSRDGVYLDYHGLPDANLLASPAELLGRKVSAVLPPELAQQVMDIIEQVCQTGELQILEFQLPVQGQVEYYEARIIRSRKDEVLAILRNITNRKRAEEALRQSEERYRQAMAQALNAIFFINRDGLIQNWNPACVNVFRYGLEIVGQSYHKLLWNSTDGVILDSMVAKVFEEKQSFKEVEISYRSKDGERRLTNSRMYPIFDREGSVKECVFSNTDISERKQAEEALRFQNEELQARNRELDAYARTVAHDLKNPLGTLTTMAEVLAQDYTTMSPEQLGECLQSMVRSGHKAIRIVEGLLLLAGVRQRKVTLQPVDMARVVAETRERMTEMIEEYQAEIIAPSAWPRVLGYAPWIEEIWTNYLSNGLKYGGKPPRLELGVLIQEDGMARFWVKDNGPGLTPEAQAQLFAEFTQLDPDQSDGYGLGLSIVRRIIEKLGGRVWVESEGRPGRGSTFNFTLPLA